MLQKTSYRAGDLFALLASRFPLDASSWRNATQEVMDLSRTARNILKLDETHAVDFRSFQTPGEYNLKGIVSITLWYAKMDNSQQAKFHQYLREMLDAEAYEEEVYDSKPVPEYVGVSG